MRLVDLTGHGGSREEHTWGGGRRGGSKEVVEKQQEPRWFWSGLGGWRDWRTAVWRKDPEEAGGAACTTRHQLVGLGYRTQSGVGSVHCLWAPQTCHRTSLLPWGSGPLAGRPSRDPINQTRLS